jgi:lysozyme
VSNSKAIKNDELKQELTRDEGVRYKPYTCSEGRLTIGIGHNLDDRGLPPHIVDALYEWDIGQAVKDLDHHLPWWDTLGDVRGRALINMAFNLGITRLLSF